jgi:hypothetical protein
MGQGVFINDLEAILHEEVRLEREGKHAGQSELLCLG